MPGIALTILAVNSWCLVQSQTRLNEISFYNNEQLTSLSNLHRRLNLAPASLLTKVFDNARFLWWRQVLTRYAQTYNPVTLFVLGAQVFHSGVSDYGFFHAMEALAMLIAVLILVRQARYRQLIYLAVVFALIPVTYAIKTNVSYFVYQNCFLLLIGAVLVAFAYDYCWHHWPKITASILIVGYLVSLLQFGHNYFNRYPLYAEEQWFFRDRLLSRYLQATDNQVIVIGELPRNI